MSKLRLDYFLSLGLKLVEGDEVFHRSSTLMQDAAYASSYNRPDRGDDGITIESLTPRENTGEQPCGDDVPVVAIFGTNKAIEIASMIKWGINNHVLSWKPSMTDLIKMQDEHDKQLTLADLKQEPCDAITKTLYMGAQSLNPDDFAELERIVGVMRETRGEVKPKRTKTEYVKCEFDNFAGAYKTMLAEDGIFYIGKSESHDFTPSKPSFGSDICLKHLMDNYQDLYRKVERKVSWFEDIPKGGVLCWVCDSSDEIKAKKHVNLITHYKLNSSYDLFYSGVTEHEGGHFSHKGGWNHATPLTQEEVKALLGSSHIVASMTDTPE